MRLLWFLTKWPLPVRDGSARASCSLIKGTTSLGLDIDLVVVIEEDRNVLASEAMEQLGLKSIFLIRRHPQRSNKLLKMFDIASSLLKQPHIPFTMRDYATAQVVLQVEALLNGQYQGLEYYGEPPLADQEEKWNAIVYDGLHCAIHAQVDGEYRWRKDWPAVVYRAQNREADLWFRLASQSTFGLQKKLLLHQGERVKRFENSLLREARALVPVSYDDLCAFQRDARGLLASVVPIGFDFTQISKFPEARSRTLLFLGRLDWRPNRDGLAWFLREVWPQLIERSDDIELCVAGSGSVDGLASLLKQERVNFMGQVEDVEQLYQKCMLCIVPIFYGSGTRVKAIEASCHGRACISTFLGVEGLGLKEGESYFRGETAQDWIELLTNITPLEAQQVGRSAWNSVKNKFNQNAAARTFVNTLQIFVGGKDLPACVGM